MIFHPRIHMMALAMVLTGASEVAAKEPAIESRVLDQVKAVLPYEDATVSLVRGRLSGKLRRREAYTLEMIEPASWRSPVRLKLTTSRGRTLWYTATLSIEVPVMVLSRAVKRGDSMVGAARLERRTLDQIPRGAIHDERGLDGLVARANLRAGLVVKQTHGERPVVIKRGQVVTVFVRRGVVVVTDRGIASAPGRVGDVIRVTSASTQKTMIGVVRTPSTVELP